MEREAPTTASIGVIALNEEIFLPHLLSCIVEQDYPHHLIEVVLVDSGSTDATKAIMHSFAAEHPEFMNVQVLDNPKRFQAPGWNVVIGASTGEVVIRVDAHAWIPSDFVSANMAVIGEGEDVCGGVRPTVIPEGHKTPWRATLHLAEESAFGSSAADFRRDAEARYVTSVFHGAYRKHVFEKVGVFNEQLLRTEDNDLHYRIRESGFQIKLDPRIQSKQYVRSSLKTMLKQKYGNGYWVGRTVFVQPKCLRAYHFAPFAFVIGVLFMTLLGLLVSWLPFLACGASYVLLCVALALHAAIRSPEKNWTMVALPIVFMGIHGTYGCGTLVGLLSGAPRQTE